MSPATRTLSCTDREVNSSRRWNVRPSPRRARTWVDARVMSLSSNRTRPDAGGISPVRTLNRVVFPAPFGPISPVTVPGVTVSETPSRATAPPNRTVTSCASSPGMSGFLDSEGDVQCGAVCVGERSVEADQAEGHSVCAGDPIRLPSGECVAGRGEHSCHGDGDHGEPPGGDRLVQHEEVRTRLDGQATG